MSIAVKNISKRFKNFIALDNVSLNINSGELIALLGPSGSGKTTLLRIIAGLEFADSGTILFDNEETTEKKVKERNVGFVFQHYALFKHMTVFENVAFGLRVKPKKDRPSEHEIKTRVHNLLKLVHIDTLYDRYPAQLSGGQRQRVALARALAVQPRVLLLDEPFGALDAKVRKQLRRWLRKLHDELHVTTIFVTHDQEEAMEVADRIVIMNNSRIEQVGSPDEVYHNPSNSFVYDFLGNYNAFEGWMGDDGVAHISEYDVQNINITNYEGYDKATKGWKTGSQLKGLLNKFGINKDEKPIESKNRNAAALKIGKKADIRLFARPHQMEITKEPDSKEFIPAKILHINPAGPLVKIDLERKNGNLLQVEIARELYLKLKLKREDEVFVRPREIKFFD